MLLLNQIKIPVEKTVDKTKEQEALLQAVAKKLNISKASV